MRLERKELKMYLEGMAERAKIALEKDFNIHGYMIYQCSECNSIYVMWLAEGLEDPTDDEKTGKHKPVPFGIICPCCGGNAYHQYWEVGQWTLGVNHRSYKKYVSQPNKTVYENFFWNDSESDCGVPVILNVDYVFADPENRMRYINEIIRLTTDSNFFKDAFTKETLNENSLKNRQKRRHPKQNDGYKRPRSNKKLYEH